MHDASYNDTTAWCPLLLTEVSITKEQNKIAHINKQVNIFNSNE